MRLIDADKLAEGLRFHYQGTDQEYETDRSWAIGYNAGLERALYSISCAHPVTPPPNDPLTLEELREMNGEPVWIKSVFGNMCALVEVETTGKVYLHTVNETHGMAQWEFIAWEKAGGFAVYRRKPDGVPDFKLRRCLEEG